MSVVAVLRAPSRRRSRPLHSSPRPSPRSSPRSSLHSSPRSSPRRPVHKDSKQNERSSPLEGTEGPPLMGLHEDAAHGCSARDRRTRRRTRHIVLHRHAWKKKPFATCRWPLRLRAVSALRDLAARNTKPLKHRRTCDKAVRACGRDDRAVGCLAVSGPGPARLQHADASHAASRQPCVHASRGGPGGRPTLMLREGRTQPPHGREKGGPFFGGAFM
jgi:hypothetical protein